METITACQLLYGSVEEHESSRRTGRTLLRGASLDGTELAEVEARLVYDTSDGTPIKRIFYRLSSGRVLIAQLVAEDASTEADEDRGYFAHCLVMQEDDFLAVGGDPDAFFAADPFLNTIAQARRAGDWHTGLIDDLTLSIPPQDSTRRRALLAEWPVSTVRNLLLHAMRAPALVAEGTSLVCKGESDTCYALLSALLLLVPYEARVHCTYDTYCYRCEPVSPCYWALCEPWPPEIPPEQPFLDVAVSMVTPELQPETPFERWICRLIATQRYHDIIKQVEVMYWFTNLLDGRVLIPPIWAKMEIPEYFYQQELPVLQAAMEATLSKSLGNLLVRRIIEHLSPQQHHEEMTAILFNRFDLQQAATILTQAYRKEKFSKPDKGELDQLTRLLETTTHRELQLLHALWSGNTAGTRQLLANVSEVEYGQFVKIFLSYGVGRPASLIVKPYASAYAQQYLSVSQRPYPEVDTVIAALVEMEAAGALDTLTPVLDGAGQETLKVIAKTCQGKKSVPESFRKAMQRSKSAGGENILQGLLSRFSRK